MVAALQSASACSPRYPGDPWAGRQLWKCLQTFYWEGLCCCYFFLYAEKKNMGGSRIPSTPSTNISKVFICSLVRLRFQVRRGWVAVTGRWPANTVLTCFLTWDVHSNACASAGSPLRSSKAVALAVLRRTPLLGRCVRCHVGLWGMQLLQRYKPEPAASPAESCLLSLQ